MSKPLTEKQKQMIRNNYKKKIVAKLSRQLKADRQEIDAFVKSLDKKLSPAKRAAFISILILMPILFFCLKDESVSTKFGCHPKKRLKSGCQGDGKRIGQQPTGSKAIYFCE